MFVECVSKIRHILSVIHYKIRRAVCFQFTHFPCDWENIHTLSYYHHQIRSINYYLLYRVRSWNNGVCCMSFCILLKVVKPLLTSYFATFIHIISMRWFSFFMVRQSGYLHESNGLVGQYVIINTKNMWYASHNVSNAAYYLDTECLEY